MTSTQPQTVTYFAISLFSSRTFWWNAANAIVALLSLTEVATLIPARYLPLQLALLAMINLWLRTVTVRPVTLSLPGTATPVQVQKIGPPQPPIVSD